VPRSIGDYVNFLCQSFCLAYSLLLLGNPFPAFADFVAMVKAVDDGDTIIVAHDGLDEHIRFNGIDAPEKTQAYGKKSKQFIETMTLGKQVNIIERGKDRYGRTIADVMLPEGMNVNRELVKEGLAWWYWKHSQDKSLRDLEDEAREEKRGLWRDRNPIPPWVFRKIQNKQVPDIADFEPPRKLPPPAAGALSVPTAPIIGNRKSHKYHRPDCPGYGSVSENNAVHFATVYEAEEAGYNIARNCPR
jgi:endonuclease YncB( thermonuclease family)